MCAVSVGGQMVTMGDEGMRVDVLKTLRELLDAWRQTFSDELAEG